MKPNLKGPMYGTKISDGRQMGLREARTGKVWSGGGDYFRWDSKERDRSF